jgi:hypothetical protein
MAFFNTGFQIMFNQFSIGVNTKIFLFSLETELASLVSKGLNLIND